MGTPLYRTVYDELKQRIASGIYPRGMALPSESKLHQEFDVSLITVRRAIDELALDGLVERRQGVGNFVRGEGRNVFIGMSSFTSDVTHGRLRLVRTLLQDDLTSAAPEVAARLGLQAGSMLRHLIRLDTEGGVPLSVDEVFIPPALATGITAEIAASPAFLYRWQDGAGLTLARARTEICVQPAGEMEQRVLQIGPETSLLSTGELIFDVSGRPVVWVITRYRSDRCRLFGSFALAREKE